jgi:dienelactone hydrolase
VSHQIRVSIQNRRILRTLGTVLALGLLLAPPRASANSQRVAIRTDDGISLAATWYEPGARAPAVILVHMLHKSRRDWDAVATTLASQGIGALAIDLRGHGESSGSIPEGQATADYSVLVRDLLAARHYLSSRGDVQPSRLGIVGASIGANLAVLEAAADPTIASIALLSPSTDYRGLRIEAAMKTYAKRPALLIASDDDPYASRSVKELQKAGTGLREALILNHAGHGTVMLAHDPDLARTLVDWFRRTLL